MRRCSAFLFVFLPLVAGGCSAEAPSTTPGPTTEVSGKGPIPCGLREASQVDGSCVAVGPADPSPEAAALFTRSVDGWGFSATVGARCEGDVRARLGEPACAPVDDCSRPFPPPGADVIVSTRSADPRAVPTLEAALARVAPGGTVALDAGTYPSTNLGTDVVLVGRCPRDTIVGDGTHNAVFARDGAKVTLRSMTLSSVASGLAARSGGSIEAENVVVKNGRVGVGVSGRNSAITLRRSVIEGLGANEESAGALVSQGAVLVLEDSEIRSVTTGLLATDPGSVARLKRVALEVLDGGPTSSGVEASARGKVEIDESFIHSRAVRLVAVHDDVGTVALGKRAGGTIVIRSSVLEQVGAELVDAPAVILSYPDSELELTDVTLRHQALIGVLAEEGTVRLKRVAFAGASAPAKLRAAISALSSAVIDAEAIAIPWAQGIGIMITDEADLDLRKSLVANVVERAEARSAVLVSSATASLTDCELANNQDHGIVAIGGSTLGARRTFVHGTHAPEGSESTTISGMMALNATASFESCAFKDNGEGIIAAGGAVMAHETSFESHSVALRAMDGMTILEDTTELTPKVMAIAACTFVGNEARTSTETLPELNAPIPAPGGSGK